MTKRILIGAFFTFLACSAASAFNDEEAELRSKLSEIATSLSANHGDDAMVPFSKSLADYEKLKSYFNGLASAFTVENEVDVLESGFAEDKSADAVFQAQIRWALNLSDARRAGFSEHRVAEISVRMTRESGKWKITGFTPIAIFNPAVGSVPPQS